ncbi:MAG: hypothetical protein ABSC94_01815 [Polyangiaceae bacterium]|jgi:hypothetical protein
MSNEHGEVDPQCQGHGVSETPSVGRAPSGATEFACRAKAAVAGLPTNLAAYVRKSPYAAVGIVFGVGMGAGVLFSSRILRTVLASAASYAAVELGRTYLRQTLGGDWGPSARTIVSRNVP